MKLVEKYGVKNKEITIGNKKYLLVNGVLKTKVIKSSARQEQTQNTFSFKWKQENTYSSKENLARAKAWLFEKYKEPAEWLETIKEKNPVMLDAGCGVGFSSFEYWGKLIDNLEYVGIDISDAVNLAYKKFVESGFSRGTFIQENIANLPFNKPMFDIIFSEGVLHHTDNTQDTFNHLCQFLKPNGLFMFYVYRKKGPIREFTDDYIREKLQNMSPEQGWKELESLTKLGIELGKLNINIDVPEDINVLDIPKGKVNLQRLFYWHVFKAFYDSNLTFEEMHHINFDWYMPKNAHRHTVQEITDWCFENNLTIEHLKEELAGITCVARKR